MQAKPGLCMDVDKARKELEKVRGHIVLQPLDFLENYLDVAQKYKLPYLESIPKAGDDFTDFLLLC